MKSLPFFLIILTPALLFSQDSLEKKNLLVREDYDYPAAMKKVASQFKGKTGVYLHLGDSLTYANPYTAWARGGKDHSDEVKKFLNWSHAGKKNDSDGYYLASVDAPSGNRSETAASGLRADELLSGAKGLPRLKEILQKYQPQMIVYMLGTNDLLRGRETAQYVLDVEKAIDTILAQGTVVILSTLPPIQGKTKQVEEYNKALRELAKKKQIPLIDLYAEMKARVGDDFEKAYLSEDGIHLNGNHSNGPATEDHLKNGGYLLRGYLSIHKGMEVKSKVFDKK
ncbi:MAG: SGNH/GDSL hydrolase family protein [Gemmataceae bacterium]|nr:SGNH/GDSL hydrolase family protein [Gemmataceae bacterium]